MPEQALHDEERHAQLLVLPAGCIVALRTQAALGQDFREWRCKKNGPWHFEEDWQGQGLCRPLTHGHLLPSVSDSLRS